jgi:DNA-damage-inducible protein J
MPARTTMLHIRVDEQLKAEATETLADLGLTVSDAVRILLTRVVRDKALPASLTVPGLEWRETARAAIPRTHPGILTP